MKKYDEIINASITQLDLSSYTQELLIHKTLVFIAKAQATHGDKYDYSKSIYYAPTTSLTIICQIHGEFQQTPSGHLSGRGCYKCGRMATSSKLSLTNEQFIERSKVLFGEVVGYERLSYKNNRSLIELKCLIHNIYFTQKPSNHLSGKNGCMYCANQHRSIAELKYNKSTFIQMAKTVWPTESYPNARFGYENTDYESIKTLIEIKCLNHGISFHQIPEFHLRGYMGCKICRYSKTREKAIENVKKKNGIPYAVNQLGCDFFDKLNKELGLNIIHGRNAGAEYSVIGYFIDGYDFKLNVVFEWDEEHHFYKDGTLKKKDLGRQENIVKQLGCGFIRIRQLDAIKDQEKTLSNVLHQLHELGHLIIKKE